MQAVQIKNKTFVKLLLENGADPNLQNSRGDTALHFAMRANNQDVIELLLKFQADPEIRNRMGMTATSVKARIQRKEVKVRDKESKFDDTLGDLVNLHEPELLADRITALRKGLDSWEVPAAV